MTENVALNRVAMVEKKDSVMNLDTLVDTLATQVMDWEMEKTMNHNLNWDTPAKNGFEC